MFEAVVTSTKAGGGEEGGGDDADVGGEEAESPPPLHAARSANDNPASILMADFFIQLIIFRKIDEGAK